MPLDKVIALTIESEQKSFQKLGFETRTSLYGKTEDFNNCIILRGGNSSLSHNQYGRPQEFKNVINASKVIRFNCCKSGASRQLSKVIDVPKYWVRNIPSRKTVIYRPIYHKAGGADFKIMRTKKITKIQKGFFASEFIKTRREYRVWFVRNGNNIAVIGAIRVKHQKELPKICRSAWSYKFCHVPKGLVRHVFLGAKALGLEFGASDTLAVNGKPRYYTCEFNSCPTMDAKRIREFFLLNLGKLMKNKFKKVKKEEKSSIEFVKMY